MISNAELLSLFGKTKEPLTGVRGRLLNERTSEKVRNLLIKRKIRTLSGVAPIAVLTKPFPCPGKCAYCPTEKEMPKSYLSNEPAVMRAVLTKFDPFTQVQVRIKALENNGHSTDKLELIIMGGTWSCLPEKYQTWFIKRCFDAANEVNSKHKTQNPKQIQNSKLKTLKSAQKINETAKHRIIGITLETRPDYIDEKEIKRWRELGATKVELGVQIINDKVLKTNKRGHGVEAIIHATKLFKQAGFKVAYHIMPNLPGSTTVKDLANYKKLFSNQDFQPDFVKIYPTVVTKGSTLYKWWRAGKYKPYSAKKLLDLLFKMKLATPEYVRIIRLIRDIPEESIVAGNKISNLRQALQERLKKENKFCQCIRCREAKGDISGISKAKLFIGTYKASDANEYFLQFASPDRRTLFAFLRLRLPNKNEQNFLTEIKNCAMIREVHTYGKALPLKKSKNKAIQHLGFGAKLIKEAEKIAKQNGFDKMAVISGIGVREYYKKFGYKLSGTYMTKNI